MLNPSCCLGKEGCGLTHSLKFVQDNLEGGQSKGIQETLGVAQVCGKMMTWTRMVNGRFSTYLRVGSTRMCWWIWCGLWRRDKKQDSSEFLAWGNKWVRAPCSKMGRLGADFDGTVSSTFLTPAIPKALSKHKRDCGAQRETVSWSGFQCKPCVVTAEVEPSGLFTAAFVPAPSLPPGILWDEEIARSKAMLKVEGLFIGWDYLPVMTASLFPPKLQSVFRGNK